MADWEFRRQRRSSVAICKHGTKDSGGRKSTASFRQGALFRTYLIDKQRGLNKFLFTVLHAELLPGYIPFLLVVEKRRKPEHRSPI